jgi:hypothetical protein
LLQCRWVFPVADGNERTAIAPCSAGGRGKLRSEGRRVAGEHCFLPDTLRRLNAELDAARKDPNVLLPGDRLEIPDPREREEPCTTDARHRFRRKGVPSRFRLQVLDDGIPQAGAAYDFLCARVETSGTLDGNGYLEEWIAPDLEEAHLRVELANGQVLFYHLRFGFLHPIETRSGVKQRLKNLGYLREQIDQEVSDGFRWALVEFQRDHQLEETGEADEATLAKLLHIHDSR